MLQYSGLVSQRRFITGLRQLYLADMECMICTEDLLLGSVGELDCCEHRYQLPEMFQLVFVINCKAFAPLLSTLWT